MLKIILWGFSEKAKNLPVRISTLNVQIRTETNIQFVIFNKAALPLLIPQGVYGLG